MKLPKYYIGLGEWWWRYYLLGFYLSVDCTNALNVEKRLLGSRPTSSHIPFFIQCFYSYVCLCGIHFNFTGGWKWGLRKEKRHKLQLFHEILCAIEEHMIHDQIARPTRIQHYSRLSYDKMMNHFIELEEKGMINRSSSEGLVSITCKGRKFIKQYDELINLIETTHL